MHVMFLTARYTNKIIIRLVFDQDGETISEGDGVLPHLLFLLSSKSWALDLNNKRSSGDLKHWMALMAW